MAVNLNEILSVPQFFAGAFLGTAAAKLVLCHFGLNNMAGFTDEYQQSTGEKSPQHCSPFQGPAGSSRGD